MGFACSLSIQEAKAKGLLGVPGQPGQDPASEISQLTNGYTVYLRVLKVHGWSGKKERHLKKPLEWERG